MSARHAPVVLELVRHALGAGGVLDEAVHEPEPARDVVLVRRTQVDGHRHAPRDGVRDIGRHVESSNRRDHVAADLPRDLAHAAHDLGGRDERVVADAHGRRTSMILDARER